MTTITLHNPWTHAIVERDITGLTQSQLDAYAQIIDDESRESINNGPAWDASPAGWLSAWVDHVGPDEAGRIILGS